MDLPLETLEFSLVRKGLERRNLLKEPYLEVGCGDGFNLERFSKLGMRGVAIDSSGEALESVRAKNLPGVDLVAGDFLALESTFRQFKSIFMLNVLEHIHDDAAFIVKAAALLPRDGYLIIAVPALSRAYGFADANAGHIRRYDKAELKTKIEESKLVIDEWLSVGFPVNRLYTFLFNLLNRGKSKPVDEAQTALSGIRLKEGYYGGGFDTLAKLAFPLLSVAIQFDRLFVRSDWGNNFLVFAKKS